MTSNTMSDISARVTDDGKLMFGSVFSAIRTMPPDEQRLVEAGECPACRPQEGRAEKMRLLVKYEAFTSYQCHRCKNVWVTNTPNAKGER